MLKKLIFIMLIVLSTQRHLNYLDDSIEKLEEETKCQTCSHCKRNGSGSRCSYDGTHGGNNCNYVYTKLTSEGTYECATESTTKTYYCINRCEWKVGQGCIRDAICTVGGATDEV